MGVFWEIFGIFGGRVESVEKRELLFSLSPSQHSPRAAVIPLPRPTATKPLRSKQRERGLCVVAYGR